MEVFRSLERIKPFHNMKGNYALFSKYLGLNSCLSVVFANSPSKCNPNTLSAEDLIVCHLKREHLGNYK